MENGWETCYVGKELLKALTIARNVRVLGYLCREQGCAIHISELYSNHICNSFEWVTLLISTQQVSLNRYFVASRFLME